VSECVFKTVFVRARIRPNMPGHLLVFVSACAHTRLSIGVKVLLACARCVCVRVQPLMCICPCALLLVHACVFFASCASGVMGVNAYAGLCSCARALSPT
jgi:hypothetical protein